MRFKRDSAHSPCWSPVCRLRELGRSAAQPGRNGGGVTVALKLPELLSLEGSSRRFTSVSDTRMARANVGRSITNRSS